MKFKKIYIEITNQCNLTCSFCIKNERKIKYLTVEQFEHILKEIKPFTDYVYLHVLGEPLLHPKLNEILNLCHKYEMNINLTTNGTLLSLKKDLLLHASIRQINISLHNFKEQNIDQKEYVKQVCEIAKELNNSNTYVSLRLWNMKQGLIDEDTKEMKQDVLNYFDITETDNKNIQCMPKVFLEFDEQFSWPSLDNDIISEEGYCLGGKIMLGILSDGTVVPCCLDSKGDISLGNIFQQSFKNILKSERYINMIKSFQNRKINEQLCKKCGYRAKFDIK